VGHHLEVKRILVAPMYQPLIADGGRRAQIELLPVSGETRPQAADGAVAVLVA
jgi:hypothetical protein